MDEEYTEDTEIVEDDQEISEEDIVEEEGTSEDNAQEDSSFNEYLDSIDPEDVKAGTFDEDEFFAKAEEGTGDDEDDQGDGDTGQPQKGHRITYKGQEFTIPEDRVVEYLQKGYDYEQKVGPHQRLAQLMEQYPDVAQKTEQELIARLSGQAPEVPGESGDSYEPDEYISEQVQNILDKQGFTPEIKEIKSQRIAGALKGRDGEETFNVIDSQIKGALTAAMGLGFMDQAGLMQIADPDTGAYVRAYETIRESLAKQGQIQPKPSTGPARPTHTPGTGRKRSPSYRTGSGGGEVKTPRKSIWERSSSDFEDIVARVKRGEKVTL